ncbi:hypothetical protein B0I37DRAFT_19149 [Chaetomium sp. MPI-CAGE-AT-0009]|nr:hypothetical protein B0I37DRAFT_19149 [Chaetomium sp. MPI-CAGE-AT-0009]
MERPNPFDAMAKSPGTPGKLGLQSQSIFESPRANTGAQDAARPAEATKVAQPEPSLAAAAELKTEPKVEPKAEPKTEVKPEPTTEVKPEPEMKLKIEPKTETKAESETEPKTPEASPSEGDASPTSAATPQVGTPNGVASGKEPQKKVAKETTKPVARTAKPTPKPLAVTSASKPVTKPEKSPRGPRTPPATSTHHPVAKKTPEKKLHAVEKPATPRATPTSKSAGPSSIKRPPPLQSSPASTGFVKPKVKSPTRPVKLPPGLTTHTASSGSKVNASRQSLSRASGSIAPNDHGRPASRTSASTSGSGSNKGVPVRGLRRQSSTINRPRPSLGPPPKQPAKDHPPVKKEKEIDQGFLARMMRPTAASASKATTKVATSPPRKPTSAPKKATPVKSAKKAVHRSTATTSSSTVNRVGAEAEHAPAAGEAIDEANLPAELGQQSAAEEVAPVAAAEGKEAASPEGDAENAAEVATA